jgi:hypothetical protein
MPKPNRTSIDDLNTIGDELTEEHLAIVPGARLFGTKIKNYTDGQLDSVVRGD